jgi:hypothetical protein
VVKADAARDLLPIVRAAVRNEPFVRFRFLLDSQSKATRTALVGMRRAG